MRALALIVMLPAIAQAGPDEKGLRIGGTLFGVDQSDKNNALFPGAHGTPGVSFGTFVTFRGSPNVALQLEGTVSDKQISLETCSPSPCIPVAGISLFYVEVPILLRIDLLPGRTKFHFDLGPELVLSLGGQQKDAMTGTKTQLDLTPGNFGVVVGAGLEFGAGPGGITIDFRYQRWAAPITKSSTTSTGLEQQLKSSNQFVLEAGYAFP